MLTQPRRPGDAYDVIVVGAGLVGAAVAARLVQEGFHTAVLEARRVAGGATGRSLGVATLGLAGHYGWAVSVYGRQRAREIWALTAGGRARLVDAARRYGVALRQSGSVALAADEDEADLLWESAKLLQDDGFDASFSVTDPLGRGFTAALGYPDDVSVDAAALTRALLQETGIRIHQGAEVYGLDPLQEGIRVWAQGRTAVGRGVVLAVDGYAALAHPHLADYVAPKTYRVLVSEPLQRLRLDRPSVLDYGRGLLRPLPDGRLMLGLCQPDGSFGVADGGQGSTVNLVRRHIPEFNPGRADRWSELTGVTPDGLPIVGQLPGIPQAYYAVGFGGRGLSWAFVAAERLVKKLLNGADLGLLSAQRLGENPQDALT